MGTARIPSEVVSTSMVPAVANHGPRRRTQGDGTTMHLAHAIAAGGLAARATTRRTRPDESEIADARDRAIARRAAAIDTTPRVVYAERGRHAAPVPVRPRPAGA
ncbi:hypothetical protein SAMN04489721_0577 [Agromyces flavus]|uniref:Uncharacterized protein n=2 Tax=Agromyces flavus TaxID=589382 RepID=A0A1H1NDP3_9MICO|nr:hypothetical protein SAMN04489721_0577 [Agromyces flavus]